MAIMGAGGALTYWGPTVGGLQFLALPILELGDVLTYWGATVWGATVSRPTDFGAGHVLTYWGATVWGATTVGGAIESGGLQLEVAHHPSQPYRCWSWGCTHLPLWEATVGRLQFLALPILELGMGAHLLGGYSWEATGRLQLGGYSFSRLPILELA